VSNILVLDIETLPNVSYHFDHWGVNITTDKFSEVSRIYSVGVQWSGTGIKAYFEAPTEKDRLKMLEDIHELISRADAVVTYNGNRFDLRRLEGEFAEFGLPPLGRVTSIDVIDYIKTLGLPSNKLEYALVYFKCGTKIKTEGMPLWIKVKKGDPVARKKMERYCMRDVTGLDRLYRKVRSRIKNHPDLSGGVGCPVCSSKLYKHRGLRYTKLYAIEKRACGKCGHVHDGKRTRVRR